MVTPVCPVEKGETPISMGLFDAGSKTADETKIACGATAVVETSPSETHRNAPSGVPDVPISAKVILPGVVVGVLSVRFRPAPVTSPPRAILPPLVPPDVVIVTLLVSAISVLKEIPAFVPEAGATVIFPLTLLVPALLVVCSTPPGAVTAPDRVRRPLLVTVSLPSRVAAAPNVTTPPVTVILLGLTVPPTAPVNETVPVPAATVRFLAGEVLLTVLPKLTLLLFVVSVVAASRVTAPV